MTLEAWVRPTALGNAWRTAIMKEQTGNLALRPLRRRHRRHEGAEAEIFSGGYRTTGARRALALNTWTHIATTYDGTALKLFVNGTQASQLLFTGSITTSTGALRIGGNNVWGEWFQGDIDEVRIYNRARTATEIQADMNTSISAPGHDAAERARHAHGDRRARPDRPQLGRRDRQRRRRALQRPPLDDAPASRRPPATGSRSRPARPTPTAGLAAGTYYYKVTAEDAAGNVGPAEQRGQRGLVADTTPPTVSITAPTAGATVSASVNRATRPRPTTARSPASSSSSTAPNLGAEDTSAPYSISWDTFSAGERPAHTSRPSPRDAAGNTTHRPRTSPVTVQNTAPAGLVGAWAFDEGSGTTAADQSGKRERRHARQRRVDHGRQVQQRALLQRHERLGHRCPTRPRST